MNICRHFIISGKVQGVFFRAGTQQQARVLKITGWVRNLTDGDVEVFACGDAEKVDQLHLWLQHGPSGAVVTAVSTDDTPFESFDEFTIQDN